MNRPYNESECGGGAILSDDPSVLSAEEMRDRRSVRLQGYDYSSEGAYFLTICTHGRAPLFGMIRGDAMVANEFGHHVLSVWMDLPNHYPGLVVDAFVAMPDHVHGIATIVGTDPVVGAIHESPLRRDKSPPQRQRRRMTISRLVGRFKMSTAKWINEQLGTRGQPVWQRNYHDHIIRDRMELDRIRSYIDDNPRRWHDATSL